jgi:apolipoprotein N-acyltransferase
VLVFGSVADAVSRWSRCAGGVATRLGTAAAIVATTAALGTWMQSGTRSGMRPGPVVAVAQPDVPSTGGTGHGFDPELLMRQLRQTSEEAVRRGPRPDLLVWPETPPGFPVINTEWPAGTPEREEFMAWVKTLGVPVMYGSLAYLPKPPGAPGGRWAVQNVVTRYDPGAPGESGRQAKRRLFPGGETMPGEEIPGLRWLGRWLAGPGAQTGWLTPGTGWTSFWVTNAAGIWPYRTAICSEAMFPETSGTFLTSRDGKPMSFLVVAGNLGGFARNRALPWYFASLRARAVGSRIGIACCINTGISGFIRPDGSVHGLVTNRAGEAWTGSGAPELDLIRDLLRYRSAHEDELATNAVMRAEVRARIEAIEAVRAAAGVPGGSVETVWVHDRTTLYSRTGDVPGATVCAAMLLAALAGTASAARDQFRLPSRRRLP